MSQRVDIGRLERSLHWAFENELPARDLIAMLRQLVPHTAAMDSNGRFARLRLAEQLLVGPKPMEHAWEAARLARETIALCSPGAEAARAWSTLGLALTLMQHFRAARWSYRHALREDPRDPVTAHNLGHLLDVKFNSPAAAVPWLRHSFRLVPNDPEVAASLAHALLRCPGDTKVNRLEATDILASTLGSRAKALEHIKAWRRRSAKSNP